MKVLVILFGAAAGLLAADTKAVPPGTTVAQLVGEMRAKAKTLENSVGMQAGFRTFTSRFQLQPNTVSLSDYAVARLLFEAGRDAGFWNLHWLITDMPPIRTPSGVNGKLSARLLHCRPQP